MQTFGPLSHPSEAGGYPWASTNSSGTLCPHRAVPPGSPVNSGSARPRGYLGGPRLGGDDLKLLGLFCGLGVKGVWEVCS